MSSGFMGLRASTMANVRSRIRLGATAVLLFIGLVVDQVTLDVAAAEVKPAAVRVDEPKAWVGQRVSFFVELRAAGSFAGAANFDLPQLPGVLVIKIGSPVVGSKQIEGASWFVQTHEFALFSQREGTLTVPEFQARFSRRDDFIGPINDVQATCPSFQLEIERPPGSEDVAFLITTESLDVSETWEPTPGIAEVGSVFKRTIVQRAEQVPGMAFAPISSDVPKGIRFYAGQAAANDQLERGDFIGERRETVSYLLQSSGTYELPELDFVWWNPKTKSLETTTLPGVSFVVSAVPAPITTSSPVQRSSLMWTLVGVASLIVAIWLAVCHRQRIRANVRASWTLLDPPEQVAARRLQHACRSNDANAASVAWSQWIALQGDSFVPVPSLEAAVISLQLAKFGPSQPERWNGSELNDALREQRNLRKATREDSAPAALPKLNPTD